MSSAERMWHAWRNSEQGQMVIASSPPGSEAAIKFAFIAGFEMRALLPTEVDDGR